MCKRFSSAGCRRTVLILFFCSQKIKPLKNISELILVASSPSAAKVRVMIGSQSLVIERARFTEIHSWKNILFLQKCKITFSWIDGFFCLFIKLESNCLHITKDKLNIKYVNKSQYRHKLLE